MVGAGLKSVHNRLFGAVSPVATTGMESEMSEHRTVEERNRAIVQQAYELTARDDLEALFEVRDRNYRVTLPDGFPVPGSWTGEDANAARLEIFGTLGADGIKYHEIIADGPNRVVALCEPTGLDGEGKRWSMLLAEFFWIEDGKITDIRPFWWDVVELRRVAESRKAARS